MPAVDLKMQDNLALVTIDQPPVNAFGHGVRLALSEILARVAADSHVLAVVLSGAGEVFVSGADLSEFEAPLQPPLHRDVLLALESLPKPCVVALQGTVLGAGVEIAAACHYRIASPEATFGMPEVTLGIVPGAGGTQRLPRLMGMELAAALLLSGRPISAQDALAQGLIDEIASADLLASAVAAAKRLAGSAPIKTRDKEVSAADTVVLQDLLQGSAKQLPRRVAPGLIGEALKAAMRGDFDAGMAREAALSDESLAHRESRALRHLFFAERITPRVPDIGPCVKARRVERVAIVGSGTMGGGIAMAFLDAGIPVSLLDVSDEVLSKGLERIRSNYASSVKRGRLSEAQSKERLDLLSGTTDYALLGAADLVIEAAPENMALKKEIFRKLDAVMKPGSILATNTSTLDINRIAEEISRPADVIGLHFFSPANVMRLLEIVRAKHTADDVIVTAFAVARRLKKIGVLSAVCYGFIGNRMMDPYQREAEKMVLEGATPAAVDKALENFGMAMGILAVNDMAGIDVGEFTRREREVKPVGAEREFRCSFRLFERGWLGQKSGRGFYLYSGRERQPNPEAEAMFHEEAQTQQLASRVHSENEIQERCLLALANEGAKLLGEGIALRASDIDVVYTSGYGFPREQGGPLFWADSVGLKYVLERLRALEANFGSALWAPALLLERLVAQSRTFHDAKGP